MKERIGMFVICVAIGGASWILATWIRCFLLQERVR
jgi:hypothetical protein